MNNFNEFKKNLIDKGLEYFGLYYGLYRGVVADNEDPKFQGRLKLRVPQFYRDTVPDYWAWGKGQAAGRNGGINWLPEVGDTVWVSFQNGDKRFPVWEYGWWTIDSLPERAKKNPQKISTMSSIQTTSLANLSNQFNTSIINKNQLNLIKGDVVDIHALKDAGLISRNIETAKIMLSGEITRKITVRGLGVTKGARAAIEAAGGNIEE